MGIPHRQTFGQAGPRLIGLKNETLMPRSHRVAAQFGLRVPAANEQEPDIGSTREQACRGQQGIRLMRPAKIAGIGQDEGIRPGTNLEGVSKIRSAMEGGVVTAGNASGLNDGAAALLIGNAAVGERAGAKPMARILAGAAAGVEPRIMGVGPAYAIPKALERAGLTLADMDIIEINEAFASQVLGCLKLMDLAPDDSRLNRELCKLLVYLDAQQLLIT